MGIYKKLIFAGTFDHLHIGHKRLIDLAFKLADRVAIGITSDKMLGKKQFNYSLERLKNRRLEIENYVKTKGFLGRTEIFILSDIYGSSITDSSFDALLVTENTAKNAIKINATRKSRGLEELRLIVEEEVRGEDGKVVSSERIRAGEIDREGRSYILKIKDQRSKSKLILPESMRVELRKPLGKVFSGSVNQLSATVKKIIQMIKRINTPMVITVGDIITQSIKDTGLIPDVGVVDLRSRRHGIKPAPGLYASSIKYINEAGTVNYQAVEALRQAINKFNRTKDKQTIVIDGEEDLLVLPAIILAPLGSLILYGQFDLGAIAVTVTEEKKKQVEALLKKFT